MRSSSLSKSSDVKYIVIAIQDLREKLEGLDVNTPEFYRLKGLSQCIAGHVFLTPKQARLLEEWNQHKLP